MKDAGNLHNGNVRRLDLSETEYSLNILDVLFSNNAHINYPGLLVICKKMFELFWLTLFAKVSTCC